MRDGVGHDDDRCIARYDRMPKLPAMNGPELSRTLQRIGFEIDHTTGSHVILRHPVTRRRAVIPTHRRDLPRGTIASILREAGVDWRTLLSP